MSGPSEAYFFLAIASHWQRNASSTSVSRESGAGELADLRISTTVSDDSLCTAGITREGRRRPCTRCRGRQGNETRSAWRATTQNDRCHRHECRPKVGDDGPLHTPWPPALRGCASRLRAHEGVPKPFREPCPRRPLLSRDTTPRPRRLGVPDGEGPRRGCQTASVRDHGGGCGGVRFVACECGRRRGPPR